MKKILTLLTITSLFTACQQDKIGYVDNNKLINEYQEKIDLEASFKSKIEKLNQKADSIAQQFQQEVQNFESEAKGLPQSAAQQKYNTLMQKRQSIGQALQQEEQAISMQSQAEIDSLLTKLKDYVKKYGKDNNYTFILGENEGGSVLYGEEAKDLTDILLTQLNQEYKKQ